MTALEVHPDADRYALLWTATQKGNATGVRFMALVEDAQAWCSSPLSSGVLHGTPWAYFWTTVHNYIRRWGTDDTLDIRTLKGFIDDGSWDERIASTGCRMIKADEAGRLLAAWGLMILPGVAPVTRAPARVMPPTADEPTLFDLAGDAA